MVRKKKKKEDYKIVLKKNYKEAFNNIRESKNYIYSMVGVFLFFAVVGYFVPAPESVIQKILEFIKELLEKTAGMSQIELISFIFLNNVQSSFFGMALGIFFGVFPVFTSIVNGYLIGFVASAVVQSEGIFVLWRLLPHGIFELPAIFISLGLGLKLGMFIFEKNKLKSLKENLIKSTKTFLLVVVPLLIIAAIIEGSLIALVG